MDDLGVDYIEAVEQQHSTGPRWIYNSGRPWAGRSRCPRDEFDSCGKGEVWPFPDMDENGVQNEEFLVIHRAPLSTHERFVAFPNRLLDGQLSHMDFPIQTQIIHNFRTAQ